MSSTFVKRFLRLLMTVIGSIGFRTAILALFFLFLSVGMVWLEQTRGLKAMTERLDFWLIENQANAFGLLNAMLSGTLALTVFSFSMVMVVLNQAASGISPRVIPEVVTRPIFQNTLGLYIGTAIYALFLRLGLEPTDDTLEVPRLGIALGMLLLVACLVQFIFFIHAVSRTIQVDNVAGRVYHTTVDRLEHDIKAAPPVLLDEPDTRDWCVLMAEQTGFYQGFRSGQLVKTARKHQLVVKVLVTEGSYLVRGEPLVRVSRNLADAPDVARAVMGSFVAHWNEYLRDDPQLGLARLTEIAIRALSPSLNDPTTAVRNVHHLSDLLIRLRAFPQAHQYTDRAGTLRVMRTDPTADQMLRCYLGPILHYGRADVNVVLALLQAYHHLLFADPGPRSWHQPLVRHLNETARAAGQALTSPVDRAAVNQELRRFDELLDVPPAPLFSTAQASDDR